MPIYLKYNTASQEIPLGYFVDSTDGNTEETALTIANTDIKLWKTGATTLANKNSGGGTHISNGIYYAVLDATDTNTVGSMIIFVHVSGALAVRVETVVLPAQVYDSIIAGTDLLDVNTSQLGGTTQTGNDVGADVDAILVDTGTTLDAALAVVDANVDSILADTGTDGVVVAAGSKTGYTLTATTGLGNQTADITGNLSGSVGSVTASVTVGTNNDKTGYALSAAGVDAIFDEPTAGHVTAGTYGVAITDTLADTNELQTDDVPGLIAALNDPTAAAIADAVWDEAIAGHLGAGSTGEALNAAGAAGDPWTTTLPGAYGAGSAGYIIGNNVNAPIATVDTVVDAIKAKTDSLTFTNSGVVAPTLSAILYRPAPRKTPTGAELHKCPLGLPALGLIRRGMERPGIQRPPQNLHLAL